MTWMNLENMMLSERSQSQEVRSYRKCPELANPQGPKAD